ncbi:MAG TPA: TetR/AcrR family transcriptional regulator [Spirochaetota bacterium]|nr:TetR/AcrR family transcriptional regulator [Spirochaetota bacterium]HPS88247.1 TetR/AcrR family transcriptional regulator [Spirochaetota bacterium]
MSYTRSRTKKEQILRAAEKIFAGKGFQDSTIIDIVREAGVSEATLYEYFSSKEELLFSIPGDLTLDQKAQLEFILEHVKSASGKIRAFIYHVLWFWETHPDYASVALIILKQNRNFIGTDTYRIIYDTFQILIPIIKDGIASGEFKADTNANLVLVMIVSTIEYLTVNKILHGAPVDLVAYTDPITDQILGGIKQL